MKLLELRHILIDCNKQLDEKDWSDVEKELMCNIPFDLKIFTTNLMVVKLKEICLWKLETLVQKLERSFQ